MKIATLLSESKGKVALEKKLKIKLSGLVKKGSSGNNINTGKAIEEIEIKYTHKAQIKAEKKLDFFR